MFSYWEHFIVIVPHTFLYLKSYPNLPSFSLSFYTPLLSPHLSLTHVFPALFSFFLECTALKQLSKGMLQQQAHTQPKGGSLSHTQTERERAHEQYINLTNVAFKGGQNMNMHLGKHQQNQPHQSARSHTHARIHMHKCALRMQE